MDKTDRIVVTGVGLVTPVGHDSLSATAAIRAGVSRLRAIPDFVTSSGAKAAGGLAYHVTDEKNGADRLLAMAIPALQEALHTAEEFYNHLNLRKSRLLLCVGESKMARRVSFGQPHVSALLEAAQAVELGDSVEILCGGHAVGIAGLQKSAALLQENETIESVIVGAVDCLFEYSVLATLEKMGRLKTDQRSAGFIPGEAAGFVVLERESVARRRGAPVMAEILAPCLTKEPAHIHSVAPLFGQGLAQVISQTISSSQIPIHAIICDINGEYYRMKEWVLAAPKAFGPSSNISELWHPAENIGDIGAASAIVLVAVGAVAAARNYFSGSNVLVWASSDDGARGAVIIRAAPQRNGAQPTTT